MNVLTDLGLGIYLLDSGFQRDHMAACYLIQQDNQLAIVETGTKDSVPHILVGIAELGLTPEDVTYIIPTHVHLDHAGGVGRLMQLCANAQLVVHEKGARHMIDPSKLQAGATAVYGEAEFNKTYGELIPVDARRVITPAHESCLDLAGRVLTFLDTPGHARHHFCIYDAISEQFFTGDTFGLAYQELTVNGDPFIIPTTTPVQFDPEALKHSINLLIAYAPKHMLLTHYGQVSEPQVLALRLLNQIDEMVVIAKQAATQFSQGENRIAALNETLTQWVLMALAEHGCELSKEQQVQVLKTDILLNAQGLDVWLG